MVNDLAEEVPESALEFKASYFKANKQVRIYILIPVKDRRTYHLSTYTYFGHWQNIVWMSFVLNAKAVLFYPLTLIHVTVLSWLLHF